MKYKFHEDLLFSNKKDIEKIAKKTAGCDEVFYRLDTATGDQYQNMLSRSNIERMIQFRRGDYKLVKIDIIETMEDLQHFWAHTSVDSDEDDQYAIVTIREKE